MRPTKIEALPLTEGRLKAALRRWFDNSAADPGGEDPDRIDWVRCIPFFILHLGCFAVILVGWSPVAVGVAIALYVLRMIAVTGFYHRYFSHRSFRVPRLVQFLFAVAGNASVQRGPLWWAAHHRRHHQLSDQPDDPHSPRQRGFLWSHTAWFLCRSNFATDLRRVPDLAKYPELRWLDRFDSVVPLLLLAGLWLLGAVLERRAPGLGTSGLQMAVWGFCISTVALFHGTFLINSLAHRFGRPRFHTGDDSRNSAILSLVTLGEGWHNNHHHFPSAARQGIYWWEFEPTFYVLKVLSWIGVVRDLKPVPPGRKESGRIA
jgi:stearoyl-CoA desaturase (delta-9 desaturase)